MFRSGDRARRWPDGELELFGRIDRQLKVRGHRIEAAGVEEQLRAHPEVHDAYVRLQKLGDLGPALIAWVHADNNVGEFALREFLQARLPEPMVPSRIAVLRELPRTANGKVDQRALPDPPQGQLVPRASGTAEQAVSRIFAEVLKLPQDAAHDDFFRLGGHSLAALRVIFRLRDECGLEVTVEEFFANAHPAAIARAARQMEPAEPSYLASPLSPQVRALWTHLQLNPHDTAYEIPLRLKVVGSVYGLSETTIDATFWRVDRLDAAGERARLGRPIAGSRAYVLNDSLRLLPPGAFGQLAIGGNALGLGYLNDPAETARRFVPDPFASDPEHVSTSPGTAPAGTAKASSSSAAD